MDRIDTFITNYRIYQHEHSQYLTALRRYELAQQKYQAWCSPDAVAIRAENRNRHQATLNTLQTTLDTLQVKIAEAEHAIHEKNDTAAFSALQQLKTQRHQLNTQIRNLQSTISRVNRAEISTIAPQKPLAPSMPALPDGCIALFGRLAIEALIAAFNEKNLFSISN